ncbi:23S rRNA pseudouridylate synthase, partial [Klebsiella pneumoniae]
MSEKLQKVLARAGHGSPRGIEAEKQTGRGSGH